MIAAARNTRPAARAPLLALVLAVLTTAPAAAGQPLFMWEVASETATITMVGSIHVGRPDFFPLPAPFEQAFAAAPVLAVEVDATSPENVQKAAVLMQQRGRLPDGVTLADRLAPEVWERVQQFARDRGSPLVLYSRFQPGFVALLLAMEEYQRQGFDPELGIDKHFLDQAREQGKEIRELETIEAQMELFLSIDDDLDDILVDEFLDQIEDIEAMAAEMVALWKAGDVAGLDRLLQEQVGADPRIEAFYRRLLEERNVTMAESVDAMLRGDEDVFVVVGAGHFAGESGLPALLEDKGWQVRQVEAEMAVERK